MMKTKNLYLIIAGLINLLGLLMHVFAGQADIIVHLNDADLLPRVKAELLGIWHTTSAVLFVTSSILLYLGITGKSQKELTLTVAGLYFIISLVFIAVSVIEGVLAAQWIVFLPISILTFIGTKKFNPE